jgi:hypothetical protein
MTNFQELNVAYNKNKSYIARQISLTKYLELLKEHNVEYQGSDMLTREQLAKTLARKNIVLN